MRTDGTHERRVTDGGGTYDDEPSWSPDSEQVTFVRCCWSLMVANRNFSGVSDLGFGDWASTWSPDGQKLAVSDRYGLASAIYVVNLDGSGGTRISDGWADDFPDWSSRNEIAYERSQLASGGTPGIYVFNPDGTGDRLVIPDGSAPSWSPDGTRLAFGREASPPGRGNRIFVANADGSGVTQLTSGPATSGDSDPDWSPTGSKLVFSRCKTNSTCWIFTVNADGSGVRRLTPLVAPLCRVPHVVGKTFSKAIHALYANKCRPGRVRRKHSLRVGPGRVISQRRAPGAELRVGSPVGLLVSLGPR
jgi:Tol biopolymer transport system component